MTTNFFSQKASFAFTAVILIFSAWSSLLKSQTQDKAPVPRLAATPGSYSWTIQYQYKPADPNAKPPSENDAKIQAAMSKAFPRLVTVRVTKVADKKKEVYHYADDSETINCVVGDVYLIDSRPAHAIGVGSTKDSDIRYKEDFYDLDWINKAEYKGHQQFQGTDCYTYYQKATDNDDERTAYIDSKTRLPVAVQNSQATLIYTFSSSTEVVELPESLATKLKQFLLARSQRQP